MTSSDSLLQPRSTRKAWLWLLIAATQCQVLHGVQQRYSTAAPDNYKVFVYPPLEINNFVQCSNVHGHGGGSWNVSGEKPFERVTDCAQTQDGCRPDDKHNVDVFFVRAVTSPTFKTVPAADAKLFVVTYQNSPSAWLCTFLRTLGCKGDRPGSYGHYEQDAKTLASWGVDFIKMDHCGLSGIHASDKEMYGNMSRALNATGRPMVFSCSWAVYLRPQREDSQALAAQQATWPMAL
mgnify:CR=1 FL=1